MKAVALPRRFLTTKIILACLCPSVVLVFQFGRRFFLHLYPRILKKRTAFYARLRLRASGFTRVMIISITFFSSNSTPVNSA